MKSFLILILFYSGILLGYAQSTTVRGRVVDSENGQALAYAHLLFQNYAMGTTSDTDGWFAFSVPDSLRNESVWISYVGYKPRLVKIETLGGKTVQLNPKTEGLGEILIEPIRNKKNYVYRPGWTERPIGFGNLNAGLYPSQIAVYYPKPDKFENSCFLEEVKVYFFKTKEQWKLPSKFRLHIYDMDENGKPGKDLLKNFIIEREAGESSLNIELLDQKIRIPEQGFFVGVEHLFIKKNQYTETKDYYINDSLVAQDFQIIKYAPIFKGELVENDNDFNAWFFGPEGWESISEFELSHSAFGSKIPLPSFRIKITD